MVDEIRRWTGRLLTDPRATPPPAAYALHANGPHRTGDSLAAEVDAVGREAGMDPVRAVCLTRLPMHGLDLHREFHIGADSEHPQAGTSPAPGP